MSTASITHHPIPLATAAAAAVAVLALGAVVVAQNDTGSPAGSDGSGQGSSVQHPLKHYPPLHGGHTVQGLP